MAVSSFYSVEDVIAAIKNADSYRNKAADTGHFIFVDAVIDAELALKQACLTDLQCEVLYYRWMLGLKQHEVSTLLGRSRESVGMAEVRSKQKIQRVLDNWEAESAF